MKEYKRSIEVRNKISMTCQLRGIGKWNKGKKRTPEQKEKLRQSHLGKKLSEEHKRKIGLARLGRRHSIKSIKKMSKIAKEKGFGKWRIGYKLPEETKRKIGLANKYSFKLSGSQHPLWQGGKSFEPYSPLFNEQLKERIRVRDNFICQLCGVPELECRIRLNIHHIDYNKKNCNEYNLISLCQKCNLKVNYNRKYWEGYFYSKLSLGTIANG